MRFDSAARNLKRKRYRLVGMTEDGYLEPPLLFAGEVDIRAAAGQVSSPVATGFSS